MTFNSYTFVVFFALVLFAHNLPLSWRTKKFNLLIASYLFYAAWNPPFVVLLLLSTIVDWFIARWLFNAKVTVSRRLLLCCSLLVNLGILGFFKYSNFILDNMVALLESINVQYQPAELDIILPMGISFYTFQTLSYTIDIYRNKMRPWNSFLDYALYVTFFPQLVAGPIVRGDKFLPQCSEPRRATPLQLHWGLSLMILGLFQKVVVADGLLAPAVEAVFDSERRPDFESAWLGTLAFSGQIFCDFSGYSTCAIGAAMCLGFTLPTNFRFPYGAIGFSDFWQRWHISLSSWLRDYLYIPMGGNRGGAARTCVNLMMTMLIGGLWHGASWTFVVWGGLHGFYLIAERQARKLKSNLTVGDGPGSKLLAGILTFCLVCLAWVFFRSSDFTTAFGIASAMLGFEFENATWLLNRSTAFVTLTTVGFIIGMHAILRNHSMDDLTRKFPTWKHSVLLSLLIASMVMIPGEERAFIYFQF